MNCNTLSSSAHPSLIALPRSICRRAICLVVAFGLIIPAINAAGEVKWLEHEYNFGAFDEDDGPVEGSFRFVNTGSTPVTVLSVRTSCGCTTAGYPRQAVMPGDTADIAVVYDPTGRPGRFSKKLSVITDAEPSPTSLLVKGVVIGSAGTVARRFPVDCGPLKLRRNAVMLGQVSKGRLKSTFLELYNRGTDSIRPSVSDLPPYIDVRVEPEVLPPGQQGALVVYFRSADCPLYGLVADSITISTGDTSVPSGCTPLAVTAMVEEDFSALSDKAKSRAGRCHIDTPTIDFGTIKHDSAPVTANLTITNDGQSTLKIRRIYTADPALTLSDIPDEIKKGKQVSIPVTINPSMIKAGVVNSRIMVITSDPFNAVMPIRAIAEME